MLSRSAVASPTQHPRRAGQPDPPALPATESPPGTHGNTSQTTSPKSGSTSSSRAPTPTHTASPTGPASPQAASSVPPLSRSRSSTNPASNYPVLSDSDSPTEKKSKDKSDAEAPRPKKELFYPSSSTSLSTYYTLVYHAITPRLALLAMLPTTVWESKRGLVEFNIVFFRCDFLKPFVPSLRP